MSAVLQYALNFAQVSETYETHSWMLLLGLLKQEDCRAAKILKGLGLEDIYGAWNEVLWALYVSNGLEPRSFTSDLAFSDRALRVLVGTVNFAKWGGRNKVQTEDLLMALAAGGVLTGIFPDLRMSVESVRKAAAKEGCRYVLPDDTPERQAAVDAEDDSFL
jgi:ATP-dependent Clp protease ATP-binding subunit ClpA